MAGRLHSPAIFTLTLWTWPFVPGYTLITLPMVHLLQIALFSAMTTISSTSTFCLSVCHAFLVTSAGSMSLLQHFQKESPQSSAQILHCVAGFSCDGMGLEELLVLLLQEACLSSINISHRSHHLECGQWGVDLQDFRLLQCSKLGKNPGCP